MFNKLIHLMNAVKLMGYITHVNMSEDYVSIDFHNEGTKYLLTVMTVKEKSEDADSV